MSVAPTLVLPFVSAAASAGAGDSVASSLFGIGKRASSGSASAQEAPIASVVEQASVRSVGRAGSAVSFVLRVLGSEGTECAASFKCAQQRVSDCIRTSRFT